MRFFSSMPAQRGSFKILYGGLSRCPSHNRIALLSRGFLLFTAWVQTCAAIGRVMQWGEDIGRFSWRAPVVLHVSY